MRNYLKGTLRDRFVAAWGMLPPEVAAAIAPAMASVRSLDLTHSRLIRYSGGARRSIPACGVCFAHFGENKKARVRIILGRAAWEVGAAARRNGSQASKCGSPTNGSGHTTRKGPSE